MNRTAASAALTLTLAAATIGIAAPAQASETKQQAICHFDNGQGGKYTQNVVAKPSIVKNGHGDHANDIIPPFTWNNGGNDRGTYPGLNWTPENQTLWANDCTPDTLPLTPALPTAPQGTCILPAGELVIPAQPEGVTAEAAFANGKYTVTYTKPADTAHHTYTWPAGFTGTATVTPKAPLVTDPLWDTEAGVCRMPDTGAGGISNTALLFGGGALGLGLVAVAFAPMIRRRNNR